MLTLKQATMLGDVPDDWDVKPLKALLESNAPGDWGDEGGPHMFRVLRSTNLTNERRLDLSDIALRALKPEKAAQLAPREGDILLERSGGGPDQPVGRVGYVAQDLPGHAFSNFLHLLRPDSKQVSPPFLCWMLYRINRTGRVLRLEQQTTQMRNLNFRDYLTMPLPVPPPTEQVAIARLLDAVDIAIDRTRELTRCVESLRRGLMQEMLPPWIGFRRVESEELPVGVECIELAKDVCRVCNGSTPSRTEGRYWRGGSIAWLPTGKVHDRVICSAEEFVTESALRECSISILPRGTVLVGMIGQGRTRGMAAYLDVEACINQNFGAFVPQGKVHGKWLFHYFDYHYGRLREVGGGTNQGALNCFLLKRLRLPLPPLERQLEVAAVLDSVESLAEAALAKCDRLIEVQESLVGDLLTGRFRVDPTILQEQPA